MDNFSAEYLAGRLEEMDKRIDKISERIDQHIGQCTTRFLGLIGVIITSLTVAVSVLGWWLH